MAQFYAQYEGLNVPRTKLLLRTKEGIRGLLGPPSLTAADWTPGDTLDACVELECADGRVQPVVSPTGQLIVHLGKPGQNLIFRNTSDNTIACEVPITDATSVSFSPKEIFAVIFSKGTKESGGSLVIWNLRSNTSLVSYNQKTFKVDTIQFTHDEAHFLKLFANEIQVIDVSTCRIVSHVSVKGVTSFKVNPTSIPTVTAFIPEKGGNPARISVLNYFTSQVINSRTAFNATEAQAYYNKSGTFVLLHSHCDVSSNSYYGSSHLFIFSTESDFSSVITPTKDGPVHDVKWSPIDDIFIITAGTMPSHSTLYNSTGTAVYEFGAAYRNTISFAPHGRFVCLAGFGNLVGDMDFYDMNKYRKIGSASAHCTISCCWSPDSRYFMTAVLAPRMNVDNGIKIFKYNGVGPLYTISCDQLYEAVWLPAPAGVYPDRPRSPARPSDKIIKEAAPVAKPAAYRPPGSTGALSALMQRERAAAGKIKQPAAPKRVPGQPPAQTSAPAPKVKSSAPKPAKKAEPAPPPAPAPLSAEEKEKKIKALRKKLKQIQELKAKQSAGEALTPEQVTKLTTESEIEEQLQELAN